MLHKQNGSESVAVPRNGQIGSDDHEKLLALITDKSLIKKDGEGFVLASGKTSFYFFDMKTTSYDPEGCNLIGREILRVLADKDVDYIGGLESGAISVVVAVTTVSFNQDKPIPSFFVRKKAKGRGTRKYIEGNFAPGSNVVLVDDVTTTGNSVLTAVNAIRDLKCSVDTVVTVVDREEGAAANLKNHGIELIALYSKRDFDL